MLQLFQPLASLFVGVAMTIYGLVHSISRFPSRQTLSTFAANMPAFSAIVVFMLGVLALLAGITLIVFGSRNLRRRWRRFGDMARHADRPSHDDDEGWEPTYR